MKILIAGAPKSGTTGLYFKVKNSLADSDARGLFEPAAYEPRDSDSRRGVVAKVLIGAPYKVDFASWSGFDKKVALVRDPRDWMISCLLFAAPAIRIFHAQAHASSLRQCFGFLPLAHGSDLGVSSPARGLSYR